MCDLRRSSFAVPPPRLETAEVSDFVAAVAIAERGDGPVTSASTVSDDVVGDLEN